MTPAQLADDPRFRAACARLNIKPTKRQAKNAIHQRCRFASNKPKGGFYFDKDN